MTGTAFAMIEKALKASIPYTEFRRGAINTVAYQRWVESEGLVTVTLLNEDQINLSARFPQDKNDFVRRALAQCRAADLLVDDGYDEDAVGQALTEVDARYDHGPYLTYIFPEESALLYAIAKNSRPRRAACLGSYYGYWAAAAAKASTEMSLVLVDIDPAAMDVARRNFELLGLVGGRVTFLVSDAEKVGSQLRDIDLLILDAEGPKSDNVPPDYRDKAIYYPHLRAALAALAPGALVVAHNVILANFTGGTYFEAKQGSYRNQYSRFLALLREHFIYTVIDSTEGTLIARKR